MDRRIWTENKLKEMYIQHKFNLDHHPDLL